VYPITFVPALGDSDNLDPRGKTRAIDKGVDKFYDSKLQWQEKVKRKE
jgi:hypothetical protein